MLITFGNSDFTAKYPYDSTPVKRVVPPSHYGVDKGWYGGNLHAIAELKDSDFLLMLDKCCRTLDVAVDRRRLEELDIGHLRQVAKAKGLKLDKTDTQQDILKKLGAV